MVRFEKINDNLFEIIISGEHEIFHLTLDEAVTLATCLKDEKYTEEVAKMLNENPKAMPSLRAMLFSSQKPNRIH
jgi:hypothetical protein